MELLFISCTSFIADHQWAILRDVVESMWWKGCDWRDLVEEV